MFRRKGIYIALVILSTLILAAAAVFVFTSLNRQLFLPQMPVEGESMGQHAQMAEKPQPPEMQEDFAPGREETQMELLLSDKPILVISISALLLDAFSIVMLCRISKKKRQQHQKESEEEDFYPLRKKSGLGNILVIAIAAAVLIATLFPEGEVDSSGLQVETKVLEAAAQPGSIDLRLRSGGSIIENTAEQLSLAGDIKVEQWLVNTGEYVNAGQPIAMVDRDSVILAIAELTELMAQLDEDINESLSDTVSNAVYTPASGRVKAIHAQSGVDVMDTVKEYGCLMRLSLDGLMAVDIEAGEALSGGMAVAVQRPDGSLVGGGVEKIADGVATVILPDDKAAYGEQVRVIDLQGNELGMGSLYIHREIELTGLAGTTERINAAENMIVGTDMALIVLKNTSFSGERDMLTEQRRLMEDELTALFSVYNSGCILAACSGRIVALNEDIVLEELSHGSGDMTALLLGSQSPAMKSYAVSVSAMDSSAGTMTVSYTEGGSSMTKEISVGAAPVFKYTNNSYLPCTAAEITAGDSLVLAMYVDESGQESIDHIILYPAQSGGQSGGATPSQGGSSGSSQSGGQGSSSGASGGSKSGSGSSKTSSGGSAGASASADTTENETEEDPYAYGETILAYITPFDKAEINVSIDEADISNYYMGRTLSLSFDALPSQSFTGTVSKIDPNGSNEDGGSTKFTVTVTLERSADMLTGMNASVVAELGTVQAGVVIPLAAICEENGDVFVYTAYDEENDLLTEPVTVKTGASDGENVEIVSGLEQGQQFYYRYADSIKYVRQPEGI